MEQPDLSRHFIRSSRWGQSILTRDEVKIELHNYSKILIRSSRWSQSILTRDEVKIELHNYSKILIRSLYFNFINSRNHRVLKETARRVHGEF